ESIVGHRNGSPIARVAKRLASRSWRPCTRTPSASRRRSTATPRSGGHCLPGCATSALSTSAWWASSPKLPAEFADECFESAGSFGELAHHALVVSALVAHPGKQCPPLRGVAVDLRLLALGVRVQGRQ